MVLGSPWADPRAFAERLPGVRCRAWFSTEGEKTQMGPRNPHTWHQEEVGQGLRRSCRSQVRGSGSVYPQDPQVLACICLPTLRCQHSSQTPKALVRRTVLRSSRSVSVLLLWLLPRSPCPKLSSPLHYCKLNEAFARMPSLMYHLRCQLYFYFLFS